MDVLLGGFLVLIVVVFGPLAPLWALNELANQAHWGWQIPFNFWTWLASLVLCAAIK
ncbi:MAG TPA: hypothetical protein VHV32_19105 [Candidatus Angelobacter sp.]|jgi:hypothetical protein|nr:hypothetical protein [Candidatus Angelobacter sp.]